MKRVQSCFSSLFFPRDGKRRFTVQRQPFLFYMFSSPQKTLLPGPTSFSHSFAFFPSFCAHRDSSLTSLFSRTPLWFCFLVPHKACFFTFFFRGTGHLSSLCSKAFSFYPALFTPPLGHSRFFSFSFFRGLPCSVPFIF